MSEIREEVQTAIRRRGGIRPDRFERLLLRSDRVRRR